ncbi:hypothetical protein VZT92_021890 [Zoarces viviparus]|uniref:Uncharacterized protein n=1 Tax=Zoarces viviparus TaxID=48416 RepID=A0AAW1EBW5_ZOAVI
MGKGGGGDSWVEREDGVKEKREWLVAGTKVVSSGLWNQELLFELDSATPLHCCHRAAPPTPPPPPRLALHPHDLCSALAQLEC